jgi:hypothetical protein
MFPPPAFLCRGQNNTNSLLWIPQKTPQTVLMIGNKHNVEDDERGRKKNMKNMFFFFF